MKIALLGKGKTGGAFLEAAKTRHELTVFDRNRPVNAKELEAVDVIVSFLPAPALADVLPILLQSGKSVVSGTTGFSYDAIENLQKPWIVASNFSLGMNIAFLLTKALGRVGSIAPAEFQIREVHHTSKLDAPSGTALRMQALLPGNVSIDAERIGDAKGLHILEVSLGQEVLRLEHEAMDRSVFAKGALYAVENLLTDLPVRLHRFEELLELKLRKELFYV